MRLRVHNSAGTQLRFYTSTTSNQLSLYTTTNWSNPINGGSNVFNGDWNEDGITDVWSKQPSSNSVYRSTSTGLNRVDEVTDGLGVLTSIAYAPMRDSTVYSKGATPATYPRVVLQSARSLVNTVTNDDGSARRASRVGKLDSGRHAESAIRIRT